MDIANKSVLIIGGTSGIGFETAVRMAAGGARVAVTGRDVQKTADSAREIEERAGTGAAVIPLAGDATKSDEMDQVFASFADNYGHMDVLVHVAGISGRKWGDGPLDSCTPDGWDIVMNSNVKSVYLTNSRALQAMLPRKSGSIINVSSVLGQLGTQSHFATHAYAASRGAVISLTRSAAVYYARDNIRMNVVCPGLLDTPMSQRAVRDTEIREALTYLQPLPPHIGFPDDVAEAIQFLASDSSKFITGITLNVDGGWTAQ